MKQLIEFPFEDGSSVVIEVDEAEGGIVLATRPGEVAAKAKETFEHALNRIKPAAAAIIAELRSLSDPPDKIEVEFGIKMSAEAGAVVASVGTEANYKVTLKWKK